MIKTNSKIKVIYNIYIEDDDFNKLQSIDAYNFTKHSKDWFNYETDYYSIDNPTARLELLIALKGYAYDAEWTVKGWQSIVERCGSNVERDVCRA